jgi:hypothetical protein
MLFREYSVFNVKIIQIRKYRVRVILDFVLNMVVCTFTTEIETVKNYKLKWIQQRI